MKQLPGYEDLRALHLGARSAVFRAVARDGTPVIVKTGDTVRLRTEFELLTSLDVPGVVKARELVEGRALVLERAGTDNLAQWMTSTRIGADEFIRLALQLAETLGRVHAQGVVHLDLNPWNILVDETVGWVTIGDFALATRNPAQVQPQTESRPDHSLAYIAPEQTGRMTRGVDHRSDLYALGCVFYQMLAGRPPFTADSAAGLLHAHLARMPEPPTQVRPDVPRALSDVVMRLLAKTPEQRYQSAQALQADLLRARTELDAVPEDIEELQLPDTLYGRQSTLERLNAALNASTDARRGQVLVLTGPAGVGKTALATAMRPLVEARGGQLIIAKFDQLRGAAPYAALGGALRHALLNLLERTDGTEHLSRIVNGLDHRGAALVEFLPALGQLVGAQPQPSELGPSETRHRFERSITRLVSLLATREHPLVLVLDDVHWADQPSMSLIQLLGRQPPANTLLLVTTRESSPLEADVVAVPTLQRSDIADLVADTLGTTPNQARALADLIRGKTDGNPFFVRSMLRHLHAAEFLRHHPDEGWTWDLIKIAALGLIGGADELMEAAIQRLRPDARELLQVAACVGNQGSLALLRELLGSEDLTDRLTVVSSEGLLTVTGEPSSGFRFAHDQVQRAALSTLNETERAAIHLLTGRTLLKHARDNVDEHIFQIVDQMELGRMLIVLPDDRTALSQLNQMAARRARRNSAHGTARDYLLRARALMPRPDFQLELGLAEASHLSGETREGDRAIVRALALAKDPVDEAQACRVQAVARTLSGDYPDALDWGRQGLQKLGFELSSEWIPLGDAPVDRIRATPRMTDRGGLATAQLLADMATPSYFTDPATFGVLLRNLVRLSLEQGNSQHAPYGYVFHGMMLAEAGDLVLGHQVGVAAIEMAEAEGNQPALARVLHTFANHLNHWVQPIRTDQHLFERAIRVALEAGELQFAAYAASGRALHLLSAGSSLDEVLIAAEAAAERARQVRDRAMLDISATLTQFVRCVRGETERPGFFDDADFDEQDFLVAASANPTVAAIYDILKLQASVMLGHWDAATVSAHAAYSRAGFVRGMMAQADLTFYAALTWVARDQLERARTNLEQLRTWEETCPANFRHRAELVDAEIARVEERQLDAMAAYDRAADAARSEGFLHEEALINDLAATFHQQNGRQRVAQMYTTAAARARQLWGAGGEEQTNASVQFQLSSNSRGAALDMHSVLKAAEAISSEVVLERLLDTLMQVCIEAAGAERAALMLEDEGQPIIRALGWVGQRTAATELPLEEGPVSAAIVNDARDSVQPLVLDDAIHRGPYRDDPFVVKNQSRSLLVLPILRQSTLVGMFWFENNLVTGAFTKRRLQVLRLLSAQIASSLGNSLMFEQLMGEIRERALAERKLRRSELRMTALFEEAPDVFILWDPMTRRVTQVNEAARQLTGDGLVGRPLTEVFTPASDAERILVDCDQTGRAEAVEIQLVRSGTEPVPVLVNATLVTDGKKALYGQAVVRDVRPLKEAEEALRQINETLEERVHARTRQLEESNTALETSNAELRQFAYLASHDLKSPIRVVSNYLQLLRRRYHEQLDETGLGYIDKSIDGAVRMQGLIDDVLAFSQVGRDRRPFVVIESRDCLGHAMENLTARLEETQGFVEVQGTLPRVFGNSIRLTQLFQNLIENGLKYRGDAQPEIIVSVSQKGSMWEFSVKDNGIGIDPAQNRRIFVIFKRLHNRNEYSGTGMGLAICKKIVEMHGGTIWVESEGVGQGSDFRFTLPQTGSSHAPG